MEVWVCVNFANPSQGAYLPLAALGAQERLAKTPLRVELLPQALSPYL